MKYLTEKEEKHLLKTVSEVKGKKAERDWMILFLGFNTGLRCSELVGLNVADVRGRDKLYVRPETAKRSKTRMIPLSKKLVSAIRNFIKLKLTWREGIQDDAPLFISKRGNRLSKRQFEEAFECWCLRAGLTRYNAGEKKALYTVHSMRHSFAKRLLQRGYSIQHVQKLLGHSSLASTGIYTEVDDEELQEAVNAL
ncbi:MAG TPA: hypothetical protein DCP24_12705 [Nitrospiraceae bacterium]|nr:hypothetical protein [Nitrospiraceae bacterium]